jgi:hypothetical protein
MILVRIFLVMLALGAGRGALLAQQQGGHDFLAMIVAVLAVFALLGVPRSNPRNF